MGPLKSDLKYSNSRVPWRETRLSIHFSEDFNARGGGSNKRRSNAVKYKSFENSPNKSPYTLFQPPPPSFTSPFFQFLQSRN